MLHVASVLHFHLGHRPGMAAMQSIATRAAPAGSQHSYTKKDHQMKNVLAMLFLALSVSASFAQTTSNVVRWKTIVGNITVSNNDAVPGINPGTTPCTAPCRRPLFNPST